MRSGAALLLGVGEGEIGAEGDHAEAGGGTLTAAEGGAGFEFALERSGEGDDEEVGGGVESDGENAEDGELKEDVAAFGGDELRDKGEEEKGGLGIEGFGQDSLTESFGWDWPECFSRGWQDFVAGESSLAGLTWRNGHGMPCPYGKKNTDVERNVTRADHFDAEEDEVGGAGVLDGVEGYGGSGQDGRDSESGSEDVKESAEESTEGRLKTFAAAAGKGAGEDVEDAGAGSDGEKKGGGEEEYETMRIEHGEKKYKVQSAMYKRG